MSKKHKEREANFLANANGGADLTGAVEDQPVATEFQPPDNSEVAETIEIEANDSSDPETVQSDPHDADDPSDPETVQGDPMPEVVAEAIAEAETVGEVAEAFLAEADPPHAPPVDVPIDPVDPPPADAPSAAMAQIDALRAQIEALKSAKNSRKVASGSKPRPNVTYTLLAKPPQWSATPQVAQLQQILFNPAFLDAHRGADGVVKVDEPTLFAAVVAGKEAGVLRTKQEAVRILQYYRSNLLTANCLRWQ